MNLCFYIRLGFTGYRVTSITGTQGTSPFAAPESSPIIGLLAPGTTQIGPFAALNDNLFNPNAVRGTIYNWVDNACKTSTKDYKL